MHRRFLEHIPKRVLAETSERCAAYDRALLYLETHVREEWMKRWKGAQEKIALPPPLGERCDEKTVSLFQRIYVGLEDSDGLKGIAKLRARSSLEEQILDSQISGDWTAALACYEQVLVPVGHVELRFRQWYRISHLAPLSELTDAGRWGRRCSRSRGPCGTIWGYSAVCGTWGTSRRC